MLLYRPMIDCDVHVEVPNAEVLFPYLPPYWVEHVRETVFKGPTDYPYPKNAPNTNRPGTRLETATAAAQLDLIRREVLDRPGVTHAVLQCSYGIDGLHNPEAATAFASATNDWLIADLLDKEPRLRAAMVVPSQIPHLAAKEIDRVGGHPGIVQVYLPVRSQHPYGSRTFHAMWEAVDRQDLVAGIHFGGSPGNPPFPSGWPSYYMEEYAGMAQVFQSQVVSIVSEGVLDLWPRLRIALVEGGFTWVPAFMWRFDKEWRNLRRLVPWVKRSPSDYMRESMRLTLQPMDAPPTLPMLLQVVDQMGSEDMLLYASDFPHQHTSDPETALLPDLPPSLAEKIRSGNARALYRMTEVARS